jgi:subtilisin family serine protease
MVLIHVKKKKNLCMAGANEFGQANGTAKGGAPHARIAAYKVCWVGGCFDTDILAAMDEGIADGVDILTLSLGSSPPLVPLYEDSIAIGAFSASQKGIITVCSAGNDGPTPASVTNVAPWIITVAASTIDRNFSSYAILGNNESYQVIATTPH